MLHEIRISENRYFKFDLWTKKYIFHIIICGANFKCLELIEERKKLSKLVSSIITEDIVTAKNICYDMHHNMTTNSAKSILLYTLKYEKK